MFQDCINTISKIRREKIEEWIANKLQQNEISHSSINMCVGSVKSFANYLVDIDVQQRNPLKSIRLLNADLDRRFVRRAMTSEEVKRLLKAASVTSTFRSADRAQEFF